MKKKITEPKERIIRLMVRLHPEELALLQQASSKGHYSNYSRRAIIDCVCRQLGVANPMLPDFVQGASEPKSEEAKYARSLGISVATLRKRAVDYMKAHSPAALSTQ